MAIINSVFTNQAPWYIKQRVKTVTELATAPSSQNQALGHSGAAGAARGGGTDCLTGTAWRGS
jgi:hypothetical protein